MSNQTLEFINSMTQTLVESVVKLTPEQIEDIRTGRNYTMDIGESEDDVFARFGIRADGLDYVVEDLDLRAALSDWAEGASEAEKHEFEINMYNVVAARLQELELGYPLNVSQLVLLTEPGPIPQSTHMVITAQVFDWSNPDLLMLERTIRKIVGMATIAIDFLYLTLLDKES